MLVRFFAHERQEIADFNKAMRQFRQNLPAVLHALRDLIAEKRAASSSFAAVEKAYLKHAQDAVKLAVSEADVEEILVQHILREDIFAKVFDNPDFHRQANIASDLYKMEEKQFARWEIHPAARAIALLFRHRADRGHHPEPRRRRSRNAYFRSTVQIRLLA